MRQKHWLQGLSLMGFVSPQSVSAALPCILSAPGGVVSCQEKPMHACAFGTRCAAARAAAAPLCVQLQSDGQLMWFSGHMKADRNRWWRDLRGNHFAKP